MKKKKLFVYGFLPAVLGFGLIGLNAASAHMGGFGFGFGAQPSADEIASRHQTMFDQQANILGLSVDEVKAAWASGKSMQTLMQEKGITQEQVQTRVKAAREQQLKTQLDALVSKGVITQAQADQRLQFMQLNAGNIGNGMGRGRHGGMMMGLGF